MRPLVTLVLLGAAVAWAVGAYFVVQGYLEDSSSPALRARDVRFAVLVIAGPPAALIWLAFSNVPKRACPACSE